MPSRNNDGGQGIFLMTEKARRALMLLHETLLRTSDDLLLGGFAGLQITPMLQKRSLDDVGFGASDAQAPNSACALPGDAMRRFG